MLMLIYIRAECEGDFALHLYACHKMMPYFFAASHTNYARYGLCYLRTMHKLPGNILDAFMIGEHVMCHQDALWNGIWSNMMIETTYMRYDKGPGGIIGVTTKPRSVQIWSESLPACSDILKDLAQLREKHPKTKTVHKEESKARICADMKDHQTLRNALQLCTHPLDLDSHDNNLLINIYLGKIVNGKCNVQNSVVIGSKQLKEFAESLPGGFYAAIQKKVVTMEVKEKKKGSSTGNDIYNTEMLYSRVSCHQFLSPCLQLQDKEDSQKNEAGIKNKLKIEVSKRNSTIDVIIADRCAALYHIHWPKDEKVQDFVDSFVLYTADLLQSAAVYLIFDRYRDYSIKGQKRLKQLGQHLRSHVLTLDTPLTSKEMTLKCTRTKIQLINIICNGLLDQFTKSRCQKPSVITGQDDVLTYTRNSLQMKRQDMKTTHKEAGVIIPQQVQKANDDGYRNVKVIFDNTDMFILLLYYYQKINWQNVLLASLDESRKLVSIKVTAEKHTASISWLPAMHALSGCNTVPKMCGTGKVAALNTIT